ncbi:Cytidine and dCMP deaminase domain-containing protein 1 [Nowakowskiella sp. JEL0078]|nr:Cytidine and dCMP deaminase domain-containing protein 1 [Nowakowskiella sp. JEL0078]
MKATHEESNRMRSRDMFMLLALWMELYPNFDNKTDSLLDNKLHSINAIGAVLVSRNDRIIALEITKNAHAPVRAILRSPADAVGCDIYVSRYPCSLCVKIMVQAGIRRCYYFPAKNWEYKDNVNSCDNDARNQSPQSNLKSRNSEISDQIDREFNPHINLPTISSHVNVIPESINPNSISPTNLVSNSPYLFRSHPNGIVQETKKEHNIRSVQRLISNNSIAFTMYIPQWDRTRDIEDHDLHQSLSPDEISNETIQIFGLNMWELDPQLQSTPILSKQWWNIQKRFAETREEILKLYKKYNVPLLSLKSSPDHSTSDLCEEVYRHAIILAHIASKRTDDPKVGVGAVLVSGDRYLSVGWNGFPKNAQDFDYPQAGADDCVEDEELKYNFIMHAGI